MLQMYFSFRDMLIGSEIPQIGMGPNLHLVES